MTFDLVSAARSGLLEQTPDGVIVIDAQERVIDINPAALGLIAAPDAPSPVGQPLAQAFQAWPGLLALCREPAETRAARLLDHPSHQHFTARLTSLRDESGQPAGRLLILRDVTAPRRAEAALQESEARFRSLLDTSPDAILISDARGRITQANSQAEALFGYTRTELIGQPVEMLVPEGQRGRHPQHRAEYLSQPAARSMGFRNDQLRARDKAGREFDVEVSLNPLETPSGWLVTTVIRDLTRHKRAEERLHLQSVALEAAGDAIVITDRRGQIIWVNAAFTQITGYTLEEVLKQTPSLFKSGEHDADFYADLWGKILAGQVWRGRIVNRRKDGSLYTEEQTIAPVRDEHGEVSHFIAVKQDITERKRAEEEIRRLKEFNEGIVQHAAEGIVIQSPNGRITFINPAGAAMLGYTPEELVGRHWTRVVPQDQWHIIEAADERRVRGEADRYEIEMRRKDEARVPMQISGNPRYDSETGHFTGTLAIFTNITERKRTEGALRRQAEHLANLNRAMQALTATLDVHEVLTVLLRELQQVVPFDSSSVFEIRGPELVLVSGRGFPNLPDLLGLHFAIDDLGTPSTVVIRTRQPYILDDAPAQFPNFQAGQHLPARIRGWMGVPLIFGNEVIGMLSLDKHEPGFYTEHHAQLALAFAAQAAIAVHNARRYTGEQDRRLMAETLREVSQAMSTSLDRERVLEIILNQLARIVTYDSASIMLLVHERLEIVAHRGLRNAGRLAVRLDPAQLPNLGEVLSTQRPVIIANCATDARWGASLQGDDYIQSWLGVPLVAQGHVIGVLNLDKAEPGYYTARAAELAETFASQAALAIDNARLYSAAQAEVAERALAQAALHRRHEYLAALNETMLDLSSRLDLDDILRSIVRRAGQLLGTDNGYIDLVDPTVDRLLPKVAVGALAESLSLEVKRGEGLAGQVWEQGQTIVVNDYDTWPDRVSAYSYHTIRAAVGVPLKSRGRIVGVLGLAYDFSNDRIFDADASEVLEQFAQLATVALDNAQLFRLEQERADELHRANDRLQTQIVEIEGLQAQLREQAIRDYLTGLFNRRYLAETLDRELAQAIRDHAALSVVILDIDHFKQLNDTHGHRAGDVVLQALGNLLRAQTRQGDIACRYGGEEFVVVMPGASAEGAYRRAETWRHSFEAEPISFGAQALRATLSLGIATYPTHSHLSEELLRLADEALYTAKTEGRNRTVIYGAELSHDRRREPRP